METIQLPRFGDTASDLPARQSYALSDFLNFHDEAFIRNAYGGILHRKPDVDGFVYYLTALRSGPYPKAEILGRLRYSREGRIQAVRVRGLFIPFAFQMAYHIPVLGYVFAWTNFILRLPSVVRNWSRFEVFTAFQQYEQTQRLNQLAERAEQDLCALRQQAVEQNNQLAERAEQDLCALRHNDINVRNAIASMRRFFLHAERLSFTHPITRERLEFTQELPTELKQILDLL